MLLVQLLSALLPVAGNIIQLAAANLAPWQFFESQLNAGRLNALAKAGRTASMPCAWRSFPSSWPPASLSAHASLWRLGARLMWSPVPGKRPDGVAEQGRTRRVWGNSMRISRMLLENVTATFPLKSQWLRGCQGRAWLCSWQWPLAGPRGSLWQCVACSWLLPDATKVPRQAVRNVA